MILSKLLLSISAILILSACQSMPQSPDLTKLNEAQIKPLISAGSGMAQPWKKFVFDIQVRDSEGYLLPQANDWKYQHLDIAETRVLRPAGSIGTSGSKATVQASTGLWPDAHMGRERARIWVDLEWPVEAGKMPSDLSIARLSPGHLMCEQWAQALAISGEKQPRYDMLGDALAMQNQNDPVKTAMPVSPYQLNGYWIIPVLITLEQGDFEGECLKPKPNS